MQPTENQFSYFSHQHLEFCGCSATSQKSPNFSVSLFFLRQLKVTTYQQCHLSISHKLYSFKAVRIGPCNINFLVRCWTWNPGSFKPQVFFVEYIPFALLTFLMCESVLSTVFPFVKVHLFTECRLTLFGHAIIALTLHIHLSKHAKLLEAFWSRSLFVDVVFWSVSPLMYIQAFTLKENNTLQMSFRSSLFSSYLISRLKKYPHI